MTRSETDKPIDRQTLYEEVWKEPVSVVAPRYGLSDVGLAKICRSLAIPLPSRGYWAMVKAGRIMKRVPLPPSDEKKVIQYLTKLPADQIAVQEEAKRDARRIRQEVIAIALPNESTTQHPLVKSTSKRLRQRDGWPTDTKLRNMPSEVLNISVTLDSLDRALQITDVLLKALEEHGITAHIDSEKKITLLKVGYPETEITFSLIEQIKRTVHEVTPSEERARKRYLDGRMNSRVKYPSIPRYDYHPTGIFSICAGHWPSRTWNDTPKTSLEKRLGEVVAGILVLAKETHAKEVEDARKKEERLRAQQHYEFLVKRRESETARLQHLEAQAGNWEREFGNANEAMALVEKAIEFSQLHGKQKLVREICNIGGSSLADRDLYLLIAEFANGIIVAHGSNLSLIGADVRLTKDIKGKDVGGEMFDIAQRKGSGWIDYKFQHPVSKEILTKCTYFKVFGDMLVMCGFSKW